MLQLQYIYDIYDALDYVTISYMKKNIYCIIVYFFFINITTLNIQI